MGRGRGPGARTVTSWGNRTRGRPATPPLFVPALGCHLQASCPIRDPERAPWYRDQVQRGAGGTLPPPLPRPPGLGRGLLPPLAPRAGWPPPLWPSLPAPAQPRLRLDIEGLRAVAVLLVLGYHADLGPFGGGYLGVDVFFVVSGFLITSLLLGELQRTGFVVLRRFWARRARRLLPASTLVIVATVVAGTLVLDPLSSVDLAHDALAAAVFVINIVLARRQSDYLT